MNWRVELLKAIEDLVDGFRRYELWHWLATKDVQVRHRQTRIGPAWFPLSMVLFALGLSFVFSGFGNKSVFEFLPYTASGLAIWGFLSRSIVESCNIFKNSSASISQIDAPLSIHIYRVIDKNFIIFLYEMIAVIFVLFFSKSCDILSIIYFLFSIPLIVITVFFGCLLLAIICVRYRDVTQLVDLAMRFMFFLTPIFWVPTGLTLRDQVLVLNPFYHLLSISRGSLLNQPNVEFSWLFVGVFCIITASVSLVAFVISRRLIRFWV
ncbi:MAG: ABC transporter permease [Ahrensia sp.]